MSEKEVIGALQKSILKLREACAILDNIGGMADYADYTDHIEQCIEDLKQEANELIRLHMNREQMIELLVDQDIKNIETDILSDDWTVVANNLEFGFVGYNNYTTEALITELATRQASSIN